MSSTDPTVEPTIDTDDPTQRVHHHARLEGGRRSISAEPVVTLCGLTLPAGGRPDAAALPCCPMCAAEMGALGRSCPSGGR